MSSRLLPLSPDLQRLVAEGYEVAFRANLLLVGVAYVNSDKRISRGFIASPLETPDGERTASPVDDHTVTFVPKSGEMTDKPCDTNGAPLTHLMNQPDGPIPLGDELVASCGFSQKKPNDVKYVDYYEKMTTYADIFLAEVHAIDPNVSIRTFAPVETHDDTVHRYFDANTSRARIGAVNEKTRGQKIAIVGVGGTGSYVLDAVAKTEAAEIHLFDADVLEVHNAYRAPGAVSIDQLRLKPTKVDYHQAVYDAMHRHVVAHPVAIDASNVDELQGFDFIFVCIDAGPIKKLVVDRLAALGVPFVDTGMGIEQRGSSLAGLLRVTRVRPGEVQQDWLDEHFSYAPVAANVYEQNIQIAELNMLNASLAVLAWKQHLGYYPDGRKDVVVHYTIDGNMITRESLEEGTDDED